MPLVVELLVVISPMTRWFAHLANPSTVVDTTSPLLATVLLMELLEPESESLLLMSPKLELAALANSLMDKTGPNLATPLKSATVQNLVKICLPTGPSVIVSTQPNTANTSSFKPPKMEEPLASTLPTIPKIKLANPPKIVRTLALFASMPLIVMMV
jgi:hypothetical protein